MGWRFTRVIITCMLLATYMWEMGDFLCQSVVRKGKLCPVGWAKFNTSCYNFTQCTDGPTCTVDESVRRCAAVGGHLTSVRSDAENDFIASLADAGIIHIYLGGRDDVTIEGDWRWPDGEAIVYNNWDTQAGEPNDHWFNGGEDCMEMYREDPSDVTWNDINCTLAFGGRSDSPHESGYVCQRHL